MAPQAEKRQQPEYMIDHPWMWKYVLRVAGGIKAILCYESDP